jgi:hypothetical protein
MKENNNSSENERMIFKTLREEQRKFTYFLLAVVGATITVVINQTQNATLTLSKIPLAIAVLLWALSFYFGCRYSQYVSSNLFANLALFRVQRGEHPELTNKSPTMIEAASKGIKEAIEDNSKYANKLYHLQFNFLIMGAFFYIIWHILEMYLRGIS